MKYQPIITDKALILDLHKPIYESHFGVWDRWLLIAKERNLNIIVNTPFGVSTYTYTSYMKGAKLKKRYYKNPDVPMKFYCRDFLPDIKIRQKRKKIEKKLLVCASRDQGFNLKGREALLRAWKELKQNTP